jgi:diguanylate cyclase (GGDEF)-like protein
MQKARFAAARDLKENGTRRMTDHPTHVLVITDDEPTARSIGATIEQLGFAWTHAAEQAAAMRCLNAENVDLIICERLMQGFDTFLFAEQVMFDARFRHIPMIYLAPEGMTVEAIHDRSNIETVLIRPIEPLKLAASVATLLERGFLHARVLREDALTRLLNRQTLQAEVERELHRVQRYQGIGSLLFLDLDRFKSVNDRFGHAVGDQALAWVARLIRAHIRVVDLAGRYGGEEFVIYMPETPEPGAITLGNRLLDACRSRTDGPPLEIALGFSAGTVQTPRDGDAWHLLVERADQAMYIAKRQGRGRVASWRATQALASAAGA